jgi:hypothetical protein
MSIPENIPLQQGTPEFLSRKTKDIIRAGRNYTAFELIEGEVYNFKKETGGIMLHLYRVDADEQPEEYIKVNLKAQWNNILSRLFEIYNEEESIFNKKKHSTVWYFRTIQDDGTFKTIEFRIVANIKSKMNVFIIARIHEDEKRKNNKDSKYKEILIQLDRRGLHGYISTFLSAASKVNGFHFSFSNHLDKKYRVGLKKDKTGNIKATMGKDLKVVLSQSDSALLKASARYKLFHGRWLGFQGEMIAISVKEFITDMKKETHFRCSKYNISQKIALASYLSFHTDAE